MSEFERLLIDQLLTYIEVVAASGSPYTKLVSAEAMNNLRGLLICSASARHGDPILAETEARIERLFDESEAAYAALIGQ